MKKCVVGVLGATGAVGSEMIKLLAERNFPLTELRPLASARSAGKKLSFKGEEVTVLEAKAENFKGCDIILGAAEADIAKAMIGDIKASGAVFVDNSSAFRHDPDVPLVIPEINGEDVKWHKGVISNANCATIITLMAVKGIDRLSRIKTLVASTYQAVSGAGIGGLVELQEQSKALAEGRPIENRTFAHQIVENLIPKIGSIQENGYSSEEMKLLNEGRKIMHNPELNATCTCVRVPVVRSHSIAVSVYTEKELSVEEVKAQLAKEPGVRLVDDAAHEIYPMPLETSDQDLVFVGRVRKDLAFPNGITLWCCGDQIRKGAALNTIQIAELLV